MKRARTLFRSFLVPDLSRLALVGWQRFFTAIHPSDSKLLGITGTKGKTTTGAILVKLHH